MTHYQKDTIEQGEDVKMTVMGEQLPLNSENLHVVSASEQGEQEEEVQSSMLPLRYPILEMDWSVRTRKIGWMIWLVTMAFMLTHLFLGYKDKEDPNRMWWISLLGTIDTACCWLIPRSMVLASWLCGLERPNLRKTRSYYSAAFIVEIHLILSGLAFYFYATDYSRNPNHYTDKGYQTSVPTQVLFLVVMMGFMISLPILTSFFCVPVFYERVMAR